MVEESVDQRLTWRTLLGVLIGKQDAIQKAASTRSSLVIGAALVLIGGLARSYDQTYLLAEPWAVVRGLPVTLIISGTIFVLVIIAAACHEESRRNIRRFGAAYLGFLGVYWLTAPMAWLYAIPYERLVSLEDAVTLNFLTLGLVSVWRVALMSRIVSVVFQAGIVPAACIVLLASGIWAWVGLILYEGPMLNFMGGTHLAPQDERLAGAVFTVGAVLVFSTPLWGIGGIASLWLLRPSFDSSLGRRMIGLAPSACLVAAVPLLVIASFMPRVQREQARRHEVDRMLRSGRVQQAMEFMNRHVRENFPPQWEPSPRLGWHDRHPTLEQMVASLEGVEWIRWGTILMARKLEQEVLRKITYGGWSWQRAAQYALRPEVSPPQLDDGNRRVNIEKERELRLLYERARWMSDEDRASLGLIVQAIDNLNPLPPRALPF